MTNTTNPLGKIKPKEIQQNCCRLCNGVLKSQFALTILRKYDIQYYKCDKCHSLQTETPYWLDEAYKQNLSYLDTGAAQRNINNFAASYGLSKLFNLKNVIDIAGGDGLLCRLLRDYEINCFVKDKYAQPTYAQGYTEPNFEIPDLVMAFEVIEHFANPMTDLDDLFHLSSKVLLMTTLVYTKEEKDWWYLVPESGQHIFFYSKESLELIANKYNYTLIVSGGFIVFIKKEMFSPIKLKITQLILKGRIRQMIGILISFKPAQGIWKDHIAQK